MKIWIDDKEWKGFKKGVGKMGIVAGAMMLAAILLQEPLIEQSTRSVAGYALSLLGLYLFGVTTAMLWWTCPPEVRKSRSRYMKYTDDEGQS